MIETIMSYLYTNLKNKNMDKVYEIIDTIDIYDNEKIYNCLQLRLEIMLMLWSNSFTNEEIEMFVKLNNYINNKKIENENHYLLK